MITVKTPEGLVLKVPAHVVATTFIAAALAQVGATQQVADDAITAAAQNAPRIGDYWPGQGGHNAGFVPEQEGTPAHYLIVGAQDLGDRAWGGRGKESDATSKRDGLANTQALLLEGDHPAATACAEHQADNHRDFYLPACAELYQAWLNAPDLFAKDCWYWSSTQRSATSAFTMLFEDGYQHYYGKYYEFRVRPVRRFFI
ncbi:MULTISPECIES: DUF1566 domain-containing protein [unclassified Pseudomonas]|uniref:DUF1566 domain-containing protein n=1 Tax=unclassified Pseudomonas TaxID=196821 RepID=UPI00244A1DC1|nr:MULTISPECIES: DUF1566 domain-containing protein [unclassified Pseudomonas]MDG9928300.1 DUF1566 domain-containing protein [Pseudomonas sp. GD04042]MDH0481136.1 DUF1566 domain-containing protein [Pseudomonas sp. GD04015]MDH0604472.1 DUF1566 domain-containing protein [Pseudomonas sp. GD03869]